MSEFVNDANGRPPLQDSIRVQLLKSGSAMNAGAGWNHLKPSSFSDRVFASVRLEVTNGDVFALLTNLLSIFEHAECLADTGSITKVEMEPAAPWRRNFAVCEISVRGIRRH